MGHQLLLHLWVFHRPGSCGRARGEMARRRAARSQVATATAGSVFRIETMEWTGGQIQNNDSADDVK